LREVICPVLELREEKRTFVKVGGGKVDFFQERITNLVVDYAGGYLIIMLKGLFQNLFRT
jgi:hypothetical protein